MQTVEGVKASKKALIPLKGYSDYLRYQVEFFGRYGRDVRVSKTVIFENTALYSILGVMVAIAGAIFGLISRPLTFLPFEVVSIFLVLTAIFEVDVMIRLRLKSLGWQYWETVPIQVAKRDGRRLAMVGMYQAGCFYLVGFAVGYLLFFR